MWGGGGGGKERLPIKLLVEKTDRAISEYSKILQKVLKERKILILKMKLMNIQIQLEKAIYEYVNHLSVLLINNKIEVI